MKLSKKLNELTAYPFHMPGHKRNGEFNINGAEIDITEIDGFDNLHNPCEIIKELEDDISFLFNSKKSIISVNGSTCCILSAISALCNKGDKIIIARNCHKSVYNACFINELDVVYVEPDYNEDFGCYTNLEQETIDKAILDNPDAKAVVITSPTYEGIVSSIKTSIPLIIDSAHGAHFGFAGYLPSRADGDIVIQSLHKTLPALTQTAVIHINNSSVEHKVKQYMDIFESSSPSYILLNSVDKCVDFLKNCDEAFAKYKLMLDSFYNEISELKNISLLKNDDPTRIVISATGYNGYELAKHLRANGIEVEGASLKYVILISTVCDTDEGFNILINALKSIENKSEIHIKTPKPLLPKKVYKSSDINSAEKTSIDMCDGKISAEYIYAYPPGVPIIVPGEEINTQIINGIKSMISNNINVISDSNLLPDCVLTKID